MEVYESVGSLMGIMGYSLSSNWASGRKCYSHHNDYQSEFPSGCMFRASFIMYCNFKIVKPNTQAQPMSAWSVMNVSLN